MSEFRVASKVIDFGVDYLSLKSESEEGDICRAPAMAHPSIGHSQSRLPTSWTHQPMQRNAPQHVRHSGQTRSRT